MRGPALSMYYQSTISHNILIYLLKQNKYAAIKIKIIGNDNKKRIEEGAGGRILIV